jgi:hypothetical protein
VRVAVDDEARSAGFSQLATRAACMGIERAEAPAPPPKLPHQLLLREDPIRLGREQRHQFELARRQAHLAPVNLDPPSGRVDQQRSDPDRSLTVGLRGVEDAAVDVPAAKRAPVALLDQLRLDLPMPAVAQAHLQFAAVDPDRGGGESSWDERRHTRGSQCAREGSWRRGADVRRLAGAAREDRTDASPDGTQRFFRPTSLFSSAMVERGKPYPDLFLFAAAAMGFESADCIVVEDGVPGVEAGCRAGMRVLGYGPDSRSERLANAGAEVFASMAELPPLLGLS